MAAPRVKILPALPWLLASCAGPAATSVSRAAATLPAAQRPAAVAAPAHAAPPPPRDGRALELGVGAGRVCAVLGDRSVRCRGGDLRAPSPLVTRAVPPARDLVLGGDRGCVHDDEGRTWCWGHAWWCGAGERLDPELPARVESLARGATVALPPERLNDSGAGLLARAEDGRVHGLWCGDDQPAEHTEFGGAVRQLSLGRSTACALLADGELRCREDLGPLQRVTGVAAPRAVVVGVGYACALGEGGRVGCWPVCEYREGRRRPRDLLRAVGAPRPRARARGRRGPAARPRRAPRGGRGGAHVARGGRRVRLRARGGRDGRLLDLPAAAAAPPPVAPGAAPHGGSLRGAGAHGRDPRGDGGRDALRAARRRDDVVRGAAVPRGDRGAGALGVDGRKRSTRRARRVIPSRVAVSATASTPPDVGALIEGRYLLEALLGEGTFGGVWRARDERLAGRPVAVKFLKAEFLEHAGAIARFEAEANALAQLPHPNIVGVLDRGVWKAQRYIVMELVDGRTLAAWIEDHRADAVAPDLAATLVLFDQMCAGIEAAHAVRTPGPIVHRDLKPDNVLLRPLPSGELGVKVLDFGIAQLGRRTGTRSGALMGTPLYMAPEQAMGQVGAIGPWTDVFSLAVILVEMLTSRQQPNADEPWWGAALQRPKEVRGLLTRLRPDVPAAVWDVIDRALRPVGAERYAHAGALRGALRQAGGAAFGASSPSLHPRPTGAASASTPPPTVAHDDLARAPTVASGPVASRPMTPPASAAGAPADEGFPWMKLLAAVALGAVLLALAIVALLVSLDGRPQAATPPSSPRAQRPAAASVAAPDAPAVRAFLARWERARRRERGAEPLDRLYAASLKYHGSTRPADFAQMTRDLDRLAALGGTFALDRARTDHAEESLEDEAVPSACRLVAGAEGPVVRVRAWVTESRPDRNADIGCPRLEGRYVLRLRATPAGLRVCHETWSIDEGICASCPAAPLCQRR
jgi:serine/threonine protein kinase